MCCPGLRYRALAGGAGTQPRCLLHQEAPSYRWKPTGSKFSSPISLYQQSPLQNLVVEKDIKLCPSFFFFLKRSSTGSIWKIWPYCRERKKKKHTTVAQCQDNLRFPKITYRFQMLYIHLSCCTSCCTVHKISELHFKDSQWLYQLFIKCCCINK